MFTLGQIAQRRRNEVWVIVYENQGDFNDVRVGILLSESISFLRFTKRSMQK